MEKATVTADSLFELGKLLYEKGAFLDALPPFKKVSSLAISEKNFPLFLEAQTKLLRIYADLEMDEEILRTKEMLQDFVLREGQELTSRLYYTLALCSVFRKQAPAGLEYAKKALALAIASGDKKDICYAISGIALIYTGLGRFEEALKEYNNLQVFFEVLDIPEIKMSALAARAHILIEQKKYDAGIELLWQVYDILKKHSSISIHLNVLVLLGRAHLRKGDRDTAQIYYTLTSRLIDPDNHKRFARQFELELKDFGRDLGAQYDLVFDLESPIVTEKKLGKVDFKNQFILLDLLRLFAKNQGNVFTKETLVQEIWHQEYDPRVHDNKIYVTIKRLRKMIEPDVDRPKYIFRAKNGYFMNKTAKVLMEKKGRT